MLSHSHRYPRFEIIIKSFFVQKLSQKDILLEISDTSFLVLNLTLIIFKWNFSFIILRLKKKTLAFFLFCIRFIN